MYDTAKIVETQKRDRKKLVRQMISTYIPELVMGQRMSFLGKNNSSFGTRDDSLDFLSNEVEPADYWFSGRVRVRRA